MIGKLKAMASMSDVAGLAGMVPPGLVRNLAALHAMQPGSAGLGLPDPPDGMRADLLRAALAWELPPELLAAALSVHRDRAGTSWREAGEAVLPALAGLAGEKDLSAGLRRYSARVYGGELAARRAGELAGAYLLNVLKGVRDQLAAFESAEGDGNG